MKVEAIVCLKDRSAARSHQITDRDFNHDSPYFPGPIQKFSIFALLYEFPSNSIRLHGGEVYEIASLCKVYVAKSASGKQ